MRIVIAEDSVLLRDGLTRLLAERGHEVVATAGDAVELLAAVAREDPDVAIVDVRMPPTFTDEGVRAALELRERSPALAVLVLSQYVEERYAGELLARDARGVGYLLKDSVTETRDFLESVDRVAAGGTAIDPEVVSQLLARARRGDPLDDLSPRERQVLSLMAEGRSNGAIAARLVVTERAVEKHVSSIFAKLRLPPDRGRPPPRARGAALPRSGALVDVAALPELERAEAPEPVAVVGARCRVLVEQPLELCAVEEAAVGAAEEQIRGGLAQLVAEPAVERDAEARLVAGERLGR